MSSMRSASSITRIFTSDSRIEPRSNMSISRPGVAISTSTPRISTSRWSVMLSPPMTSAWVSFRYLPYWTKFSATCNASSRVGSRIRLRGMRARAREPVRISSIGRVKLGGLAGAGLRRAQHVAAHQHDRDRLLLDRRRMAVAHLGDGAQHRLGQAEIGKQRARGFFADRFGNDDRRVFGRFRRGGRAIVQIWSSRWLVAALRRSAFAGAASRRQSARNEPGIRSKSVKVKFIALPREAGAGHRNPTGS